MSIDDVFRSARYVVAGLLFVDAVFVWFTRGAHEAFVMLVLTWLAVRLSNQENRS